MEMDQFKLELEGELTPESVGAKPGNILVPISNHFNMYHLGNVLDRVKPGRRDVVVLHVRILRRSASGEQELDADQLFGSIEQHLFSQALSMAEKRGKSIRLAVVAANDLWDGILRAGQSLQSSTIVVGTSSRWQSESKRGRSASPGKNFRIPNRSSTWKCICRMATRSIKFLD